MYTNTNKDLEGTAYALAALLAFIAMACLVIVAILRPKEES